MSVSLVSTLAERVRDERLRLGWTQADAAARSRISPRSYQRFEQSAAITWPRLERVLAALGLSLAIVPADGVAPPEPSVMRTRQRGVRHTRAASRRQSPSVPSTAVGGASRPDANADAEGSRRLARPKPPAPVDPGAIAAVMKGQRDRILMAVRAIVFNRLDNYTSYQAVRNVMNSAKGFGEADRPAFVAAVASQLDGLNADNIAGYGIGQPEFARWLPGWKPALGIIDVLAPAAE